MTGFRRSGTRPRNTLVHGVPVLEVDAARARCGPPRPPPALGVLDHQTGPSGVFGGLSSAVAVGFRASTSEP